jgi:pimeloyl-ACP methyl ester carboxylesterase
MSEERVTFNSKGLTLAGVVRVPARVRERRPAFIVLHGFGSNKSSSNVLEPCAMFEKLGYVTLRFDMPGCGESEGERGRLICLDQVAATSDALTFLAKHPAVEPDRIALIGSSFGAAVAVYTGAVDGRVAAAISSGGWGDGERKFRCSMRASVTARAQGSRTWCSATTSCRSPSICAGIWRRARCRCSRPRPR